MISINTRKLFNNRGVLDITHARATVLLRKYHTNQAEVS